MRIMLDTNILISMMFFPSANTMKFAERISEEELVICDYVIEELRLVAERKFPKKVQEIEEFFNDLAFEMVYTPKHIEKESFPEMRDPKDSPILATAILENIDVFITGDKDFLVLNCEHPEILTMTEFMERYQKIILKPALKLSDNSFTYHY